MVKLGLWRIVVAFVCIFGVFWFFEPVGFDMASLFALRPANSNAIPPTITHIVLFQFKRDASPGAVDVACARMMALKESCVLPTTQQTYIKSITGGKDHSPEGLQDGLTHGFVVEFASTADRDYYVSSDPVHQTFKKDVATVVEKATVLDFTNGSF
ncbi:stress responsive A/B barrel domain-containing protein [Diplogelasinospora grovesii]|uniref:Stress responsive A/B barrel domain-containing protein n=1 Tax=Diplogelasinospora grovesii TaxID=303347 RepID=A0AAN6NFW5_9PEZI|nr:stress responsive A/B barrel domain-containing protein [Diplogelasinospora grovesii]